MKLFSVADSAEILKLNQISGVEKDEANKENEVGIISDPKHKNFIKILLDTLLLSLCGQLFILEHQYSDNTSLHVMMKSTVQPHYNAPH